MKKRPILVIIVSVVLIATGIGGSVQHNAAIRVGNLGGISIAGVEIVAITSGVFMLLGHNWARWLAMLWITFHVVLSIFHPWMELVVHIIVFALFAFVLFRRDAREYFQPEKPQQPA